MARHPFCGSTADWAMTEYEGQIPTPTAGANVTAWDSITGGSQIVDLAVNYDGSNPIDHVTSSDGTDGLMLGQVPMFYGPDGVWEMWIQADEGPRVRVSTVDVGNALGAVESDLSDVAADLAAFEATKAANSGLASLNSSGLLASAQRPTVAMTSLTDVNLTGLTDTDMLKWDSGTSRWIRVGTAVSWTTLTMNNGSNGFSSATGRARLLPISGMVELQIYTLITTSSNTHDVTTLPSQFRPTFSNLSFPCACNNISTLKGRFDVGTDGAVTLQAVNTASGNFMTIYVSYTP